MNKLGTYRTLILGVLSPFLAAVLGGLTYSTLTRASENRDADFVFRLSLTAAAMAIPFVLTTVVSLRDRVQSRFTTSSKIGLAIATLSLALLYLPIHGAVSRAQQAAYLALEGVPAPEMETPDLNGKIHRLSDYRGKVVLLNIWATWCGPCRKEMPELDRLYQERSPEGLVVLGLSIEDRELQREFWEKIPVSYPLLTQEGHVPATFGTTARYPSNFLIDRKGMLRRAPSTDEPFDNLVRLVDELLAQPTS